MTSKVARVEAEHLPKAICNLGITPKMADPLDILVYPLGIQAEIGGIVSTAVVIPAACQGCLLGHTPSHAYQVLAQDGMIRSCAQANPFAVAAIEAAIEAGIC